MRPYRPKQLPKVGLKFSGDPYTEVLDVNFIGGQLMWQMTVIIVKVNIMFLRGLSFIHTNATY